MAAWAPRAQAVVIFADSFDYTNGPLVTVDGSPWVHHAGSTTGEVKVVSGRVLLSQTNSEHVSAFLAGQPYPNTTNVALYAGFTITFVSLPSASGDYFAHFKGSGTSGFNDRIGAMTNGAAANSFRLVLFTSSGSSVPMASNLVANTDYRVVTRYVVSSGACILWLNPSLETDPPGATLTDSIANTISTFAFRETGGIGTFYVDNLTVGTSFDDVVAGAVGVAPSIVAEPQDQTVTAGSAMMFSVMATGSPPLNYQWSFNATNISGATASSLTISNVAQKHLGAYAVVVTNALGSVTSSNAVLSMYPFLHTPFTGAITYWGKDATLSVQAWGTGPLSYQWFKDGAAIDNATNQMLTLSGIQFTNAGLYSVVVSSPWGSVTNTPARLIVNPAGTDPGLYAGIAISGVAGYSYEIQYTMDLTVTNSWVTLTNLTLQQPVQIWADTTTNAAITHFRFYRILPK